MGSFAEHSNLMKKTLRNMGVDSEGTSEEWKATRQKSKEAVLAMMFLTGVDKTQYGNLLLELENNNLKGNNEYPTTLTEAYHLLINWKIDLG